MPSGYPLLQDDKKSAGVGGEKPKKEEKVPNPLFDDDDNDLDWLS